VSRLATRAALCAWLGLLVAACAAEPLAGPLSPPAVSPRAFELFAPPVALASLGPAALGELEAAGGAELVAELPDMQGVLGQGEAGYHLASGFLRLRLATLDTSAPDERLRGAARLEPLDAVLSLELTPSSGPSKTCGLHLQAESRAFSVEWALGADAQGMPRLMPVGRPGLEGAGLDLWLDPGCTVLALDGLMAEVAAATEAALQAGLDELVDRLGGTLAGVLGLRFRVQGSLGGLRFDLAASAEATSFSAGSLRVGLAGGFEATADRCVPPGLAWPEPGDGLETVFVPRLPGTGEAYGLAVAVPLASLQQGLGAVHRAGLLCRRVAGQAPLPALRIEDLLPSLRALGDLRGTRVAIWPEGSPELGLDPALGDERLPRVLVRLPAVGVDVYVDLDGADVRALGCVAEIFLTLAPELGPDGFSLRLKATRVGNLEITFELLPAESGPELRQAASALLASLAGVLVGGLQPLDLSAPAAGRGEVLEAWNDGRAVTLYLAP
jgi:hypothetical protein